MVNNWLAALQALSLSLDPIYCDTITAPPAVSAANTFIRSIFIISIRETADTAASPAYEIIIVAIIDAIIIKIWSINIGIINFLSDSFENILVPQFLYILT